MTVFTGLIASALVSLTLAIAADSHVSNCSSLTKFDIDEDAAFVRAAIGLQTLNFSYVLMPEDAKTIKPLLEDFKKSIEEEGKKGKLTDEVFKKGLEKFYTKSEKAVPGYTKTITSFSSSINKNPLLFYYTAHEASWDVIYCAVKEANNEAQNTEIEKALSETNKLITASISKSAPNLQKIADDFYRSVNKVRPGFLKEVSDVASKRLSSDLLALPANKSTPAPSAGESPSPDPSTTAPPDVTGASPSPDPTTTAPPNVNGSSTSEPETTAPASRNLSHSLRVVTQAP